MKVGSALAYKLGLPENIYGYEMQVLVFLGDAFRFAVYDYSLNVFKVHETLLKPEDVGEYKINVTIRLVKDNFDESYNGNFMLVVWDDDLAEEKDPWFPNNPIFLVHAATNDTLIKRYQ